MRKLLTCGIFIGLTAILALVFVTATTYLQLATAVALYPLLVYLAFKAFPRKNPRYYSSTQSAAEVQPSIQPTEPEAEIQPPLNSEQKEPSKLENISIADIDKRMFLKLIGGVGVSLFLFSLFNKKAEGLFFKSLPTPGKVSLEDIAGNKIDPAQNQPMDGYRISEIDDNAITFYGFTNKDGAWFVMKEDTDTGSFRYAKGDSNFPGNWSNRENLNYDYFSNIF